MPELCAIKVILLRNYDVLCSLPLIDFMAVNEKTVFGKDITLHDYVCNHCWRWRKQLNINIERILVVSFIGKGNITMQPLYATIAGVGGNS